jgi:uncharacterized protein YabN with tetrapyrrole methylase and pyrophosphatase domain
MRVIEWARDNGCPWDKGACFEAAKCGMLEALRWLRREGCPWDQLACAQAARENNHETVVAWILGKPEDGEGEA